ncbi:ATP-dependent protease ClpP protease subunit [Rhodoligotrophos appendicifer]|uniref:head maturation protease, ClpP-related n=1 Tax=Rhodoligotrophos appendicifer TaxID=987056 RepID=UPI00147956BC|nr:head maturation protease, ClpP-related [Rhodoligotrophos appendicifer]
MDILVGGELYLYGAVGESFWEEGFTSMEVVRALAEVGRNTDVTVHLNSGGGNAFEGQGIYNALRAHAGIVTVIVEGIAGSAASIITMGGSKVVMRRGSTMMIHDPSTIVRGTAAALERTVKALNTVADGMADIYAAKTGKPAKTIRDDMRAEIWLTADEAVAESYADSVDETEAEEPTAFDYRIYQHTPEPITALSDARGWSQSATAKAAPTAPPGNERKPKMTAQTTAEPKPAETTNPAPVDIAAVTAAKNAAAAEIAEICIAAGVPAMASVLIKEGVSTAEARTRADGAKQIRAAVEDARKSHPAIEASLADEFIQQGVSLDQVRSQLFQKMVASQQATAVNTWHQPASKDVPRVDLVADMKRRLGITA